MLVRQVVFNTRRIGEEEPSVRQRKRRKRVGKSGFIFMNIGTHRI